MGIEEQYEELLKEVDTQEERASLVTRAKDALVKHRYQILIGVIVIGVMATIVNKKDQLKESLTETKIVEKIVYRDRVVYIDNKMCIDLSKMYSIKKAKDGKIVDYNKSKYKKTAKGLTTHDGIEIYVTKYDPLTKSTPIKK